RPDDGRGATRREECDLASRSRRREAPRRARLGPMSARAIHVVEYVVLALALAGIAYLQRDQLGVLFWVLMVGPDIGLVVAPLLGPMPGGGRLPARAVPIYNAFHTVTLPV